MADEIETQNAGETTSVQPFGYVEFDPDTGALIGSYFQLPPPAHAGLIIAVDEDTRARWYEFRANEARDGLELLPPVEVPPPSPAKIISGYMAAVQQHLDAEAVRFGYDDIVSVVSYAEESAVPRYQTEGLAFRAWRSLVWAKCEEVLGDVQAARRAAPTFDELIAELPVVGIEPATTVAAA